MTRRVIVWAGMLFAATALQSAAALPHTTARSKPAHLYVTEYQAGNPKTARIAVFGLHSQGNTPPEYFIAGSNTQFYEPEDMVWDSNGHLYVYDSGSYQYSPSKVCSRLLEFGPNAAGNATPLRVISGEKTGFCYARTWAIAVDDSHNVYISDNSRTDILVYTPHQNGNVLPAKVLTYVANPGGITFDAAGHLWNTQGGEVDEYGGDGKLLASVTYPGKSAYFIAVKDELLYAPLWKAGVVVVTSTRSLKTVKTLKYPPRFTTTVSVDDAGNVYVFWIPPRRKNELPAVLIYPPGATQPTESLTGALTGLIDGGEAKVGP